jgi:hypothetical protein
MSRERERKAWNGMGLLGVGGWVGYLPRVCFHKMHKRGDNRESFLLAHSREFSANIQAHHHSVYTHSAAAAYTHTHAARESFRY